VRTAVARLLCLAFVVVTLVGCPDKDGKGYAEPPPVYEEVPHETDPPAEEPIEEPVEEGDEGVLIIDTDWDDADLNAVDDTTTIDPDALPEKDLVDEDIN